MLGQLAAVRFRVDLGQSTPAIFVRKLAMWVQESAAARGPGRVFAAIHSEIPRESTGGSHEQHHTSSSEYRHLRQGRKPGSRRCDAHLILLAEIASDRIAAVSRRATPASYEPSRSPAATGKQEGGPRLLWRPHVGYKPEAVTPAHRASAGRLLLRSSAPRNNGG